MIDIFVDELDLATLGFEGVTPAHTGRPAYHPGDLSKLDIYGYLNSRKKIEAALCTKSDMCFSEHKCGGLGKLV